MTAPAAIDIPRSTVVPQQAPLRSPIWGFIWTLVRTDFKSRYSGGRASGFVWALFKPFAIFLVLFGVFSFLFARTAYVTNLLVGTLLFDFFSESTRAGMMSLFVKGFLITKARFQSWILVVASTANALITLFVFSAAILVAISIVHGPPKLWGVALFLLYLVLYYLVILGFAFGSSVLFLKFRDLNQIWDVLLQAGFFVAPIIYPLEILPERYHAYLYLWPPTVAIQFSRAVLIKGEVPTLRAHLLFVVAALASACLGYWFFRRSLPRAVERL